MYQNFFAQLEAADALGFGTAWVAQAHLSTEVQKRNRQPVVPHWEGEVGLCTDFFQLAGAEMVCPRSLSQLPSETASEWLPAVASRL